MQERELRRSEAAPSLLTTHSGLDRLLGMMARWWKGWGLARIAREYGMSRQRVAAILAKVGCTRALWRRADHYRPDSARRALAPKTAQARAAMLHPLVFRLTVRQRATLGWQAQGLALVDIARRMRTSPQNVRNLQAAGRRRLERLSRSLSVGRATARGRQNASSPVSPDDDVSVDWRELLLPLTQSDRPATGGSATLPPQTATERKGLAQVASFEAGSAFPSPPTTVMPRARRS